jgi:hypothetical protein
MKWLRAIDPERIDENIWIGNNKALGLAHAADSGSATAQQGLPADVKSPPIQRSQ